MPERQGPERLLPPNTVLEPFLMGFHYVDRTGGNLLAYAREAYSLVEGVVDIGKFFEQTPGATVYFWTQDGPNESGLWMSELDDEQEGQIVTRKVRTYVLEDGEAIPAADNTYRIQLHSPVELAHGDDRYSTNDVAMVLLVMPEEIDPDEAKLREQQGESLISYEMV